MRRAAAHDARRARVDSGLGAAAGQRSARRLHALRLLSSAGGPRRRRRQPPRHRRLDRRRQDPVQRRSAAALRHRDRHHRRADESPAGAPRQYISLRREHDGYPGGAYDALGRRHPALPVQLVLHFVRPRSLFVQRPVYGQRRRRPAARAAAPGRPEPGRALPQRDDLQLRLLLPGRLEADAETDAESRGSLRAEPPAGGTGEQDSLVRPDHEHDQGRGRPGGVHQSGHGTPRAATPGRRGAPAVGDRQEQLGAARGPGVAAVRRHVDRDPRRLRHVLQPADRRQRDHPAFAQLPLPHAADLGAVRRRGAAAPEPDGCVFRQPLGHPAGHRPELPHRVHQPVEPELPA